MTSAAPLSTDLDRRVRVLIVDDSALVRELLSDIISTDPELEVVGTASDPIIARERIKSLRPDVLTLDVEMPRMNGVDFLEKLMRLRPMPVVMISSLTREGAGVTLRALELGAVDFVEKPATDLTSSLPALRGEILAKIKAAARSRPRSAERWRRGRVAASLAAAPSPCSDLFEVIGIGASTGGVEAVTELLRGFPADPPGIVVTQHMAAAFLPRFAARLAELTSLAAAVATDGEPVAPGRVLIAPGDRHLRVVRAATDGGMVVRLGDDAPVSGHRPSVDVMFSSIAAASGRTAGVILTGMGRDGAEGLARMRASGSFTIAQDEATATVFGMPRAAAERGAARLVLPLPGIAGALFRDPPDASWNKGV